MDEYYDFRFQSKRFAGICIFKAKKEYDLYNLVTTIQSKLFYKNASMEDINYLIKKAVDLISIINEQREVIMSIEGMMNSIAAMKNDQIGSIERTDALVELERSKRAADIPDMYSKRDLLFRSMKSIEYIALIRPSEDGEYFDKELYEKYCEGLAEIDRDLYDRMAANDKFEEIENFANNHDYECEYDEETIDELSSPIVVNPGQSEEDDEEDIVFEFEDDEPEDELDDSLEDEDDLDEDDIDEIISKYEKSYKELVEKEEYLYNLMNTIQKKLFDKTVSFDEVEPLINNEMVIMTEVCDQYDSLYASKKQYDNGNEENKSIIDRMNAVEKDHYKSINLVSKMDLLFRAGLLMEGIINSKDVENHLNLSLGSSDYTLCSNYGGAMKEINARWYILFEEQDKELLTKFLKSHDYSSRCNLDNVDSLAKPIKDVTVEPPVKAPPKRPIRRKYEPSVEDISDVINELLIYAHDIISASSISDNDKFDLENEINHYINDRVYCWQKLGFSSRAELDQDKEWLKTALEKKINASIEEIEQKNAKKDEKGEQKPAQEMPSDEQGEESSKKDDTVDSKAEHVSSVAEEIGKGLNDEVLDFSNKGVDEVKPEEKSTSPEEAKDEDVKPVKVEEKSSDEVKDLSEPKVEHEEKGPQEKPISEGAKPVAENKSDNHPVAEEKKEDNAKQKASKVGINEGRLYYMIFEQMINIYGTPSKDNFNQCLETIVNSSKPKLRYEGEDNKYYMLYKGEDGYFAKVFENDEEKETCEISWSRFRRFAGYKSNPDAIKIRDYKIEQKQPAKGTKLFSTNIDAMVMLDPETQKYILRLTFGKKLESLLGGKINYDDGTQREISSIDIPLFGPDGEPLNVQLIPEGIDKSKGM